jgi:hypothetical protein
MKKTAFFYLTLILWLSSVTIIFAQNDSLNNIPNLYFTKNNKKVTKINIKSPLTFVSNSKKGEFLTTTSIKGFVKKIIDSNTIEILPISKVSNTFECNKSVEYTCHTYTKKSFPESEIISLVDYNLVEYQSKNRKRAENIITSIGGLGLMFAIAMIPSMKLEKDLLDGANNDAEIRIASGGLGLAIISVMALIPLSSNNYHLSPCENCKSKKNIYVLKQLVLR